MENKEVKCKCGCGKTFLEYNKHNHKREYINHHINNTLQFKEKMRLTHKEKIISIEQRKKQSEFMKNHNPFLNKHHTDETKKRISLANKGKIRSKKTRENIRRGHLGIDTWNKGLKNCFSKKTINHFKKIRKGENNSMFGKHHTREAKSKISLANKGNECSEKTRLAVSLTHIGIPKSEETIEKMKKSRRKQILPVKDTTIEVKIQNFLQQLNLEYFTHQYMNIEHGYQCDILIPSMNLVIECDGDYWHKYPIGNKLDHIRTKELLENGFKVLRLWEREIRVMDLKDLNTLIAGVIENGK